VIVHVDVNDHDHDHGIASSGFGRGELLAVVAVSGSGKWTLFRLLGGLDTASGGSLRFEGQEIAPLGIVDTLLTSVLERTREVGVLKSLGASDGDIVALFLAESGCIGLAGGRIGLGLGTGVAWLFTVAINPYARELGLGENAVFVFSFSPAFHLGAVIFAALVSLAGGRASGLARRAA
jgi:hypothetical protein